MAFPLVFENDTLRETFRNWEKGTSVDFTIPGFVPPPATICRHGLSLDLCEDPVNHYPQDTGWADDDWWGGVDG